MPEQSSSVTGASRDGTVTSARSRGENPVGIVGVSRGDHPGGGPRDRRILALAAGGRPPGSPPNRPEFLPLHRRAAGRDCELRGPSLLHGVSSRRIRTAETVGARPDAPAR